MERGSKILLIGTIIIFFVAIFFAYLVGIIPQAVVKTDLKDFDVLKIEYAGTFNNDTVGSVNLSVKTNRDNMFISAHANNSGCAYEFTKAGFHTMYLCFGDPMHGFSVSPINVEHNFTVCASYSGSLDILYKIEPACKSIILPPYQKGA